MAESSRFLHQTLDSQNAFLSDSVEEKRTVAEKDSWNLPNDHATQLDLCIVFCRWMINVSILIILFSSPGRLLDATHQYMHVFLLAGCEVVLSAFIITLGNFFCIKKKPQDPGAKLEMAVSAAERDGLNPGLQEVEEEEEELKGKGQNGEVGAEDVEMVKENGQIEEEESTSI